MPGAGARGLAGVACRWGRGCRGLRGGGLPCRGRGRGSFAAGASAAVGLAGSFAVVACAGAGAAGVAAGFSRGQGRGSVVHCLQWCASGVRRGGLCAARAGVRCLAWAGGAGGAGGAGVRPAGGKQQSYKYSKKSMSRKHQSQHPLTTTRNFTSFFPEKATGVASKE